MTNEELTAIEQESKSPMYKYDLWLKVPALVAEVRRLRAELGAVYGHDYAKANRAALELGVKTLRAERDALRDQWSDLLIEQARLMALRDDAIIELSLANAQRGVLAKENMALGVELDALRRDAALLDALQAEHERFDPVAALVVKVKHDRNGSDWANVMEDIRAALTDALAVQP